MSMVNGLRPSQARHSRSLVSLVPCAAGSFKHFAILTLSLDPSTGALIGTCPEFDTNDAQSAIVAAADAFPAFRAKTGRERSKLLRAWYDQMIDNADDIATLITWENGKPLADAKGEATYAANFLEWFSEEAPRVYGNTIPTSVPGNRVWTLKEPVGVCGLITP